MAYSKKYGPRYLKMDFMDLKDHWALGIQYDVAGSNGNQYTVEITDKGLTCDCMGMTMHGKCKHTRGVMEGWEKACADKIGH